MAVRNIALLGATGELGSHLLKALRGAGYVVTAVQRKESTKMVPDGVRSIKTDLSSKDELLKAFEGQDVVVSAAPNPEIRTARAMIDAALATPSVKRIVPSEFSTNLEAPLARTLPIVADKVEIREYLTAAVASAAAAATNLHPTTWTSINNGPFFEMCLGMGVLGPNLREKRAVFRDGGDNLIGVSRLCDIGAALVAVLDPAHWDRTANQPVYIRSAAVTERYLTQLASRVTGIDFAITHMRIDDLIRDAEAKRAQGDASGMFSYYFRFMYTPGYGGHEFQQYSWNEPLRLPTMGEAEIEDMIRGIAKDQGVL